VMVETRCIPYTLTLLGQTCPMTAFTGEARSLVYKELWQPGP